jgi:hypothetical protein
MGGGAVGLIPLPEQDTVTNSSTLFTESVRDQGSSLFRSLAVHFLCVSILTIEHFFMCVPFTVTL